METKDILGLLGGLALFLYGMKMMSDGLVDGAGDKLEYILERLTHHKLKAVVIGMLVTCVIQSSSAMTVMLIGFINARVMKLERAAWVVMGANIGTTITGQMIALDIGVLAPIIAMIGVILLVFLPARITQILGQIIAGLGILFMGLEFMAVSMMPLQSSEFFIHFMTQFSNPLFGVALGALFTALIQSSSASMGILQTLALQGLISFQNAAYIVFGFNIGTCITAFLASLTGCQNAKRLTLFHIIFNVFGTIVFLLICNIIPLLQWIHQWTPDTPMTQLANLHTLFNTLTAIIFLFVDQSIFKLIDMLMPLSKEKEGSYI